MALGGGGIINKAADAAELFGDPSASAEILLRLT